LRLDRSTVEMQVRVDLAVRRYRALERRSCSRRIDDRENDTVG
jgi:hypothetical protein